ncbi:hypothetical protein Syun_001108 [Stephania yunnanensis]|uniref:Uncharacterized protein n=1 Tax=Stephania yunnanensis TaxID=152371 RepID=A0AAP0Q6S8_9MAGN
MITEGYYWKSLPDHQKEIYWEIWKAFADFKAMFDEALENRKSEKGSPGTGLSKHTGGTKSFRVYEDVLALDRDEDDEVTPNDVFHHVHSKDHDGVTFIDNTSARLLCFHATELVRRCEEHTQATPNRSIDKKQLDYDTTGECSKGRVYGLGSLAKRKSCSKACTVQGFRVEPLRNVHGLRSKHLSGTTTTATTSGTSSPGIKLGFEGCYSTPKESLKGVQGVGQGHL